MILIDAQNVLRDNGFFQVANKAHNNGEWYMQYESNAHNYEVIIYYKVLFNKFEVYEYEFNYSDKNKPTNRIGGCIQSKNVKTYSKEEFNVLVKSHLAKYVIIPNFEIFYDVCRNNSDIE